MAQAALRHLVFGLAASGLLMGCVEGAGPGAKDGSTAVIAPARGGAARDVEAPEVFQTTESALWDGRPSLGGIWVASPEVTTPERVVMVNPATGQSVQGALFRRERDNPGPRLQISSDAAEALGILAGQPVEIRVTALRREEPEAPVETETPAADPAADPASDPAATEGAAEVTADAAPTTDGNADAAATAAAATAALAAAGAEGVADVATDAAADTAVAGAEAATGAVVADPPKRKTWKERRAEAKAAREAKKAAAAAAKAAEAAATAGATPADGAEVAATAEAASVAAVETAPLDARAPEAVAPDAAADEAAPVIEPPKTRRQIRAEAAAAQAAAEAAAAEAATVTTTDAPVTAGRLIQIASFSKEENANRAVEALAKTGVSAQTRKSETDGKVVWGVVATGDAELLASIKAAGFADAFFLQ